MAQNTVQNSSQLYPEDIILYVAEYSTDYTTVAELTSATWLNVGSLSEYSRESANASAQPPAWNVEHDQVITKEAETINVSLQEFNSSIVVLLRGGVSQQVSTTIPFNSSSSTEVATVLYNGGADVLTPFMLWEYATFADGRSRQAYFPFVHYVSGGSYSPKAQASGEYGDISFTMEARESTSLTYTSRQIYSIEAESTSST